MRHTRGPQYAFSETGGVGGCGLGCGVDEGPGGGEDAEAVGAAGAVGGAGTEGTGTGLVFIA